ncbi:ABC transporter permease [Cupriavidus necator]|uniref:ABC transporter permease n=1 Tax=Cupriavidus necator TaxID=106590 RepID=UPI0009B82CA6|nr:ABC transporter permease [Cupriavidus necator]
MAASVSMERAPAGQPHWRLEDSTAVLEGLWTFPALHGQIDATEKALHALSASRWDISGVERFDTVGLRLLVHSWDRVLPEHLACSDAQRALLEQIITVGDAPPLPRRHILVDTLTAIGEALLSPFGHVGDFLRLLGGYVLATLVIVLRPRLMPWRELSVESYRAGVTALGITALVGYLIGMVLSYLSAQQLLQYGANIFIVDFLGIAVLRELGPLLCAILIAGRSGSALTARIGAMKLSQELDAMSVHGISHTLRLYWPMISSLALAVPLLTLWTTLFALAGGAVAARAQLDIPFSLFIDRFRDVVPVRQLYIGLAKGVMFGFAIGMVGCYFGERVKPDSTSVGTSTTASVVASITLVIVLDAIVAIALSLTGK